MEMIAIQTPDLEINHVSIKKGIRVYRALNSQLRQKMLDLIHKKGRITVTELFMELDLEQPVASNHLAILREAGFVSSKRMGKNVFYTINYSRVEFLQLKTKDLLNECQ
jgi:DNA-binding transcriptional ArsR family regulator